jgi:hypothetical protein
MKENNQFFSALKELVTMAERREHPMGDPSALFMAKANLAKSVRNAKKIMEQNK